MPGKMKNSQLSDIHGGEPEKIFGTSRIKYDFSVNLNPIGTSEAVNDYFLSEQFDWEHYPDSTPVKGEEYLAEVHQISKEFTVVGNGATELFGLILNSIKPKKAAWLTPGYSGYQEICNATYISIDPIFSLEQIPHSIELVFIGHPNNPTGSIHSQKQLLETFINYPNIMFVIDESFIDFLPNYTDYSLIDCIRNSNVKNCIVVKSLTKMFAIAGVRLGVAFAPEAVAIKMRQCRYPWSVNRAALGVIPLLYEKKYIDKTREVVASWRSYLVNKLNEFEEFTIYESVTNFITVELKNMKADVLQKELVKHSIFIRSCSSFVWDKNRSGEYVIRIAVKSPSQTDVLIGALNSIFGTSRMEVEKQKTPAIMIVGTMSDFGKSALVTGLCRLFADKGISVAPFKAQNMALNSFVTKEGGEMGRAQVVQSQGARVEPHCDMNPVLLKPSGDMSSQVIVNGKPLRQSDARDYYKKRNSLAPYVHDAYDRLASRYDLIILEGAGSPAEINIQKRDIVNMNMAEYADAMTILVADIDRGGVFAAIYGTIKLIPKKQRHLIKGVVINKFRGDASLLDDGIKRIEKLTGVPVLGVLPYIKNLAIEEEDSLGVAKRSKTHQAPLDIAIIAYPRMSNYTDFFLFESIPDVGVRYVENSQELGRPDLVILPGTKNTRGDMEWVRKNGFESALHELCRWDVPIIGICGGYQMLGKNIIDNNGVEGEAGKTRGLGFLDFETELINKKELTQFEGVVESSDVPFFVQYSSVVGYEIHMGTTINDNTQPFILMQKDGVMKSVGSYSQDEQIFGTYIHGFFDTSEIYKPLLTELCNRKGLNANELQLEPEHLNSENGIIQMKETIEKHLDLTIFDDGILK
jgi:cobyric acid synthase CobQ